MPHTSHHPPCNADCRGGVFATRRFPRPSPIIRANHTRNPTVFIAMRCFGSATRFLNRDAARHVATKTVGSTLIGGRRGWQGMRDAEGSAGRKAQCGENRRVWWGTMGGGIFAKTAKTPPLQSALAGIALRSKCHCRHHAPTMPPRDTRGCYNDAARVGGHLVGS